MDASALDKARRALDLTKADLYALYLGVTGDASRSQMEVYLNGHGPGLAAPEHDKLVLALNECFLERGLPERLPFENE